MRRERVTQLISWLGLAWLLLVSGYYIFASEGAPLTNLILHQLGLR